MRKSAMPQRWLVLFLCSLMMIGSYYCYDNPAALQRRLKTWFNVAGANNGSDSSAAQSFLGGRAHIAAGLDGDVEFLEMGRTLLAEEGKTMSLDDFNRLFNLLYTVYSIPNIVLPFYGGFFVAKLGARWMNVLFVSFIVAGQFLVAFGVSIKSFPVMLAGRVLFGLGGESLCVGQSTIIAQWFEGKEMAFALGVNLSIARAGSAINNITSLMLADWKDVPFAFWFGAGICVMSFLCAFFVVPLDKAADEEIKNHKALLAASPDALPEVVEEETRLSDVRFFKLPFWLLAVSCVVVYGCVLPFNNNASDFLYKRFEFTCDGHKCSEKDGLKKANSLMMIPFLISAIASPFLGGMVDRFGGRAILATASAVVLMGVHSVLSFLHGDPSLAIAPLVFQGVAYSVFAAALWPSVPYTVDARMLGTAYGLLTAIQNGGLGGFPIIISFLQSNYTHVEYFFVTLAALGAVTGVVLNYIDYTQHGSVLNKSHPDMTADEAQRVCMREHNRKKGVVVDDDEERLVGDVSGSPSLSAVKPSDR